MNAFRGASVRVARLPDYRSQVDGFPQYFIDTQWYVDFVEICARKNNRAADGCVCLAPLWYEIDPGWLTGSEPIIADEMGDGIGAEHRCRLAGRIGHEDPIETADEQTGNRIANAVIVIHYQQGSLWPCSAPYYP